MDLAALATPADHRKLAYLRDAFRRLVHSLDTQPYPAAARRDARPMLQAAANASMYDGVYRCGVPGPIVRKYYAFAGDFCDVYFTLDLFTLMPDPASCTRADTKELVFLVRNIAALLVGEIRLGLREELRI